MRNIENENKVYLIGLPTLLLQAPIFGNASKRASVLAVLALSITLLTGCGTTTRKEEVTQPQDDVIEKVFASSERISRDLDRIAKVVYHESPVPKTKVNEWKGALATPISLYWPGDLETGVAKVAELIGYQVKIKGQAPAIPKTVIINASKVPAGDVLESLGWQAGRNIGVIIDDVLRVVQIVYVGKEN